MNQRRQFSETMLDVMESNPHVCVLLGDIGVFAFREHMARWPMRCINAGVSEQGMVGMAAGMAASGLYPVIHTIDSFLARRAYEFLRLDFGEQNLPGLFVSVGHDRDYAALGPSHHCPEGHDLIQCIPNMLVVEPANANAVDIAIRGAIDNQMLAYIRMRDN